MSLPPPAHIHSVTGQVFIEHQVLCWAWPPVLGTRGPQTPPQPGQQGREAAPAESISHGPATAAASSAWSGEIITISIPTYFRR